MTVSASLIAIQPRVGKASPAIQHAGSPARVQRLEPKIDQSEAGSRDDQQVFGRL